MGTRKKHIFHSMKMFNLFSGTVKKVLKPLQKCSRSCIFPFVSYFHFYLLLLFYIFYIFQNNENFSKKKKKREIN